MKKYQSFAEFYPFYLGEHQNIICRRLHFIGSSLSLLIATYTVFTQQWILLILVPVAGYAFAWIGHYFFEKNTPATFTYPIYSFMGDWVMFKDILIGRIKIF
ncbi:MAG: Mpo1-like protein [Arenicella sp.]